MKILEINKFNHVRGGADKHFVDLVKLLNSNGNEAAVFSMSHPKNLHSDFSNHFVSRVDYENGGAINKIKGGLRIFWSFEARRKIAKILDEFRPDVVHIHNIYHQISPSILPEIKKRGIPIVMTVHDWKLICPNYLLNCEVAGDKPQKNRCGEHSPEQNIISGSEKSAEKQYFSAKADEKPYCEKCVAGKYWHCVPKKCVKNSYLKSLISVLGIYFHRWLGIYEKNVDLFIAPSRFVRNILVQAGFSEGKIKVLPHFANIRNAHSAPAAGGEKFALYFGRISKEKNIDELTEIFRDMPIKLVLAGSKESGFDIPLCANTEYAGFKNNIELNKLIQESVFVVSASRLPETFGLIALEAISAGKPFVGYKTGGYDEIIENGQNGYLANNQKEFKDKIMAYASGNKPNFEFPAEKFNPEKYNRDIIDIFRSVC
ncbi:MAG: glycosyltransferase [Parcubacteria group bacterium]|jgi:glycosyltransferase involved in cell wall biosynthesis